MAHLVGDAVTELTNSPMVRAGISFVKKYFRRTEKRGCQSSKTDPVRRPLRSTRDVLQGIFSQGAGGDSDHAEN